MALYQSSWKVVPLCGDYQLHRPSYTTLMARNNETRDQFNTGPEGPYIMDRNATHLGPVCNLSDNMGRIICELQRFLKAAHGKRQPETFFNLKTEERKLMDELTNKEHASTPTSTCDWLLHHGYRRMRFPNQMYSNAKKDRGTGQTNFGTSTPNLAVATTKLH